MATQAIERTVVEDFRRIPTTNISDALDRLKVKGGCEGIVPMVHGVKIVGTAFTVRFIPARQTEKKPWPTYIDRAKPGDVIVIDNGGRSYCTIWGGLLSMKAIEMKIAGTVIEGVCRDVDMIRHLNYPVYSRGHFMMTGKDRLELAAVNEPVTIANLQVRPGDIIVGDDSGVVVVPLEIANKVLEAAKEISGAEGGIADEIRKGVPLTEARAKFGYGELQRSRG